MSWRRFRTLLSTVASMPNSAIVNRLSSKDRPGGASRRSPNSYTITKDSDPAEVRAFFRSIATPKRKTKRTRRQRPRRA